MTTDVYVQAQVGVCSEFIGENGEKAEVSVVISPVKVEMTSESKMKIVTGCNLWKSCHNSGCFYSMASRQREKQRV